MSVDVTSYVIAGIKIQEDDLYLDIAKRGCNHKIVAPKAKFCSKCGKSMWEKIRKPRPEYDVDEETFCGFDIIYGCTDARDIIFVGQKIAEVGDYDDFAKQFDSDYMKYSVLMDKIKIVLEPLKLWKQENFGWWLVQVVSY